MHEYFKEELHLLQEAVQKFARKYPAEGSSLNLTATTASDPEIERLLEGVAFLTGQIKKRLDADVPEISARLIRELWPHLLRPFPAVTIMQFVPRYRQLQQSYVFAVGTVVKSVPVQVERQFLECKFTTTKELIVNPLQLCKAEVMGAEATELVLKFKVVPGVEPEGLELSALPIYLQADMEVAESLLLVLTSKVQIVRVRCGNEERTLGGQEVIQAANLSENKCLLPNPPHSYIGLQLIQEYFVFPQKYLFIAVCGLEVLQLPAKCLGFELYITTACEVPYAQRISADNFQLNCVPAVNLYPTTCEPIRLVSHRNEYQIVLNAAHKSAEVLYSVDSLDGVNNYKIIERADKYYLQIGDDKIAAGTVSTAVTACNANCPWMHLDVGDITVASAEIPDCIEFSNLERPSRVYYHKFHAKYYNLVLMQMNLHYQDIANLAALRQLLSCYDWSGLPENERKIAGITALEVEVVNKIIGGIFKQGLIFKMEMQENNFDSRASIYLFGMVLYRVFVMYVPVNYVVELVVRCEPTGEKLKWSNRHGTNCLL